ncbi:endopeptidase lactocepin (prtP) [Lacticaseibacillus zeae DSM 20178 = KCTC 3804]|uniref:Endopeptidase lactocepin (PrtP) n=1 Tax=Lacticaseibacillus zeae DSM 20178 = KCTC 3804 TaxID=1423816 RepID=A0A0R1F023_LACZE|nr:endopeptidase lactocepin (prtP) [Lacticaseibacillus zeae DSM 20178 = KCTC 3804]
MNKGGSGSGANKDGTGNDPNNNGGTLAPEPNPGSGKDQKPGEGGGSPADTKQQPSTPAGAGTQPLGTAGKDDTTPQLPASTGQGDGTSTHDTNQQTSKKDILPRTAEVGQAAALAFLGAFITSIVGFLGVHRRRKEH